MKTKSPKSSRSPRERGLANTLRRDRVVLVRLVTAPNSRTMAASRRINEWRQGVHQAEAALRSLNPQHRLLRVATSKLIEVRQYDRGQG